MLAMFWEAWGVNEWGSFAVIITAILTLGGGLIIVKIRNWAVKLGKNTAAMAVNLAHLPDTTEKVNGHGKTLELHETRLDGHDKQLAEHKSEIKKLKPGKPEEGYGGPAGRETIQDR